MQCEIYRSSVKVGAYLYVANIDDFTGVPASLLTLLGRLEHVMSLELSPEQTLAQADPVEISRNLAEKGYLLQLPSLDYTETQILKE